MADDRYEKGWKLLKDLDPKIAEGLVREYEEVAPDFAKYVVEHVMGDVYSRPHLDIKQRQLIAIASSICLGLQTHLEIHIRFGLKAGLSKDEIVETILQTSVHCGFPRASLGLSIANKVFEEKELY